MCASRIHLLSIAGSDYELPQQLGLNGPEDVVAVVHRLGISTRVVRLRPLAVIKG